MSERRASALAALLPLAGLLLAACSPAGLGSRSFVIWSDCGGPCVIRPGGFYTADVPDTFAVHLQLDGDRPLAVGILTNYAYADFIGCFQAQPPADPRRSYRCLLSSANLADSQLWTGSEISIDFTDAEGCAGYLMVVAADARASVPISPRETVTYSPAPQPTGTCTHMALL